MSNLAVDAAFAQTQRLRGHQFKRVLRRTEVRVGDSHSVQRLSLSSAGYLYKREGAGDRQQASAGTEERSLRVTPDQLVINPMWLTGGSIAVSKLHGAVSPDYRVFEASLDQLDPRYLHHLLRSQPYRDQYNLFVRANTTFDRRIQQEDLDHLPLWLPEVVEQRRIADFLDDRVARIDQIITARRDQASLSADHLRAALGRLMDTLAAQFGLAPLRRFCGGIEQGSSPVGEDRPAADGEDGLLKTSAIQAGRFVEEFNKVIDPDVVNERFRVADGDVLVTRGSGSADLVGDAATVRVTGSARLYLSDLTYRVKALSIDPEFTTLAIISPRGRAELGSLVRQGTGPAKARGDDILAIPIPNAPPSQQTEAVRAAEDIRADTDPGVNGLTEAVRLLSEYKQSLITAAVTGEVDVTTAGSGIPG